MSIPLLSTKFNIPAVGINYVRRPRLLKKLDESTAQKACLVLVCGPAGYGKTMVVTEWLQSSQEIRPDQLAWLTLERVDDNLVRFLTYFIKALQRIHPGFGEGVIRMLLTHKPPPTPVLATLLVNELNEITGKFFLVLDDYHLVTAEAIQSFITFLVEHQPSQLCLVLITRTDPPLPLARLRARGQLVELRQYELCFMPEEVEEFANQKMALALSPEQLTFLVKQTEGWISGLQLAAISIRDVQNRASFFKDFSGEHEFIADYLTDEVLVRLPEPVRIFLLQTSILERLSAPLCEAVTGQSGAQTTLEQLLDANLFIVPLDNQQVWYRYHILFTDLLRKRLQNLLGEKVHEFHRRASRWYQDNEQIDLAIGHALAGQDNEQAAGMIEQIAERYLMYGEATTLLGWLEALPKETILKRPVLGSLKGFAMVLCGRSPQEAMMLLKEMTAAGSLDEFEGETTTLRALLAILQGKSAEAIQLSQRAMQQLPEERAFFRSLAADSLGMAHTLAGDIEAATPAFEQVVDISMESDNVMMALMALTNLAGLRYVQGQLHHAISICRQVLELANQRIGRQTPIIGKTLLNLGEMLREQGDLDTALNYLLEAAEMMEFFSEIGLPLVWLSIARVKMHQEDWEAAQAYIEKAHQKALATQSTTIDDRLVDVMQTRYWIARGELGPVIQWARGRGLLDKPLAEVFNDAARNSVINEVAQAECITLIRLALVQRQFERALEMIAYLQELIEKRGYRRRTIEILVLKALALQQKGEVDQALETLGVALNLGETEGYQRTFVDEGEPIARLLYQAVARDIFPTYAGRLLGVLAETNRNVKSSEKPSADGLIEPLSERELEVLDLIAKGLSNSEIAGLLYISLSTVKGHTTNIYGKLSVKNRTQAVAQARSLGLLAPK